jgi:hypothetical protein
MSQAQWLTHIFLATQGAEIRRIKVQGKPRKIVQETPISKITKTKQIGDVVQEVDHQLCKCEAPSSNPSTPKKKKKN